MNSPRAIVTPTRHELEDSLSRFQADWGLVDEVLYDLCTKHPGHSDRRAVIAKFALVGRAYAAGLERRVSPPRGKQAIDVIGAYALKHCSQLDQIVHGLDGIHEPLDATAMGTIVEQHGRLTELLQVAATDGKAPRSFASKYLHFHRPVVPIYDDYVRQTISRRVRWERSYAPFPLPPHGDPEYWNYCVRFFRLYDACRQAGTEATVKELDAFLWAVPVSGAPDSGTTAA